MDFKVKNHSLNFVSKQSNELSCLSFYEKIPINDIDLETLEFYAVDRLKVLWEIERLQTAKKDYETAQQLSFVIDRYLPLSNKSTTEQRDKDLISHFLLRCCFCHNEEDRIWFIKNETKLFESRYYSLSPQDKRKFISENFPHKPINFQLLDPMIKNSLLMTDRLESKFYKIPFTEAGELIGSKKAYLNQGFAYFSEKVIGKIFRTQFNQKIAIGLQKASNIFDKFDERIQKMIEKLRSKNNTFFQFGNQDGTHIEFDELKNKIKSFPLCMKLIYEKLIQDHHLKHQGRIQLGLFLKGIGLSVHDSIRFWKQEFLKKMTEKDFEKDYIYGIKYNYGLEGKRVNWSPYSCPKIIGLKPAPDDFSGCPFKFLSTHNFKQILLNLEQKPNEEQINELISLKEGGHCQVACQRYWDLVHPGLDEPLNKLSGIEHPNSYFKYSEEYYEIQKEKEKEKEK
ncbi:DNA primase large subunit [Anaeramoeba ignava]|uniref:DNA primase large subunit n=1 Tax=Anaeramoeba ignava TaxID=1746090 RepID=A0A9Q0LT05_ANAIG|nr:DNA primase large subunit [Anaeramoeba ignava]